MQIPPTVSQGDVQELATTICG